LAVGEQEKQDYRDIFKRAVGEARNFFRDSFDSATQGADIFLRDGLPRSITGKAAQAINRRQCEVWGKNPSAFRPVWSGQLREICIPYLEDKGLPVGEDNANSPFVGGQCSGVFYRANGEAVYDLTNCSNGGFRPDQRQTVITEYQFPGPILSVTPELSGKVSCGQNQFVFRIVFDGGEQETTFGFVSNPLNALSSPRFEGVFEGVPGSEDCGNPPPEYESGSPYGPPLPAPPQLVPGDPTSPGFDITVNPDGSIDVCSGDTCITINPGPDGELPASEGGAEPGSLEPGDQGSPGDETGAFDGVAEGEDPTRNLVGVLVQTVAVPNRANRFFNNFESYTKGAYFVFFGGDSGFAQNPEAALSRVSQFYYAPPGCNKWRVVGNVGYTLNVTPYYSE